MSLRPGQGEQIVLDALRSAAAHGLDTLQVMELLGTSRNRAAHVLNALMRAGKVQRQWAGGRATARWWLDGMGPKIQVVSSAPRVRSQPPSRLTLDPNAPAIVPLDVKVIHCPAGKDMRFTFMPPDPNWLGQISRDALEARKGGGHHGG